MDKQMWPGHCSENIFSVFYTNSFAFWQNWFVLEKGAGLELVLEAQTCKQRMSQTTSIHLSLIIKKSVNANKANTANPTEAHMKNRNIL